MVRDTSHYPGTENSREERRDRNNPLMQPEDVEGEEGNMLGYTPNPEDLQLKAVYGDWLHYNTGDNLHGGIAKKEAWQGW